MARFCLSDCEWLIIASLLPRAEGKKNGRPRPDDRKVLNGIFFVLRTGTPWRDLPERNGPYTRPTTASIVGPRKASGCACSRPWQSSRHRVDNAIGRSPGGLSTKINAAVDKAGMPIHYLQ